MNGHDIVEVRGNVAVTGDGTSFAIWKIPGLDYGFAAPDDRAKALHATATVLRTVPRGMILGLCTQIDPTSVIDRMVVGVDLTRSVYWGPICDSTLDELLELPIVERTKWLVAELPSGTTWTRLRDGYEALVRASGGVLHLNGPVGSDRSWQVRQEQARTIARNLPGMIHASPATEADIAWIQTRAPRRGGEGEPLLGWVRGENATRADQIIMDEGARSDTEKGAWLNPFTRRLVKIATDTGVTYQALLALGGVPSGGMAMMGCEWLAAADQFEIPIDWVYRWETVTREKAMAVNRRQARELQSQIEQHQVPVTGMDGQITLTDAPEDLRQAQDDLTRYDATLATDRSEAEIRATAIFAVSGTDMNLVEDAAQVVQAGYKASGFTLARPIGGQTQLYQDMLLPGRRLSSTGKDYTQIATSTAMAAAGPLASIEAGDATGALVGYNLSGGGVRPVLSDPARGPVDLQASSSMGVVAENGAGKSVGLKIQKFLLLARDSRTSAVTIDVGKKGEWALLADACPWKTDVVRTDGNARMSIDPLRVFTDPREGARVAQSFVTVLLGVSPSDPLGTAISERLSPERITDLGGAPSLPGLIRTLRDSTDPDDQEAGRKLAVYARTDVGRVVFDANLPPLQLRTARDVTFWLGALPLPVEKELANPTLFTRMPVEKVFGRALMYALSAIAREIAFRPGGFCGVFMDEARHMTLSSTESAAVAEEFVTDGRKHDAAVFLAGQHPDHLGAESIRSLLTTKYVLRHRSEAVAKKCARFLLGRELDTAGDEDDETTAAELAETISTDLSPLGVSDDERLARLGEAIMSDQSGRRCRFQFRIPNVAHIPGMENVPEAILSTPVRDSAATDVEKATP